MATCPAGSIHSREQAAFLSAMEPAMLAWAAARDRDSDDDSDGPPQEVEGLLAALALRDDGLGVGGGPGRNTARGVR